MNMNPADSINPVDYFVDRLKWAMWDFGEYLLTAGEYNYRAWTPPVEIPDLEPRRFQVVFMDLNRGTVWFEAIMTGEQVAEYRKLLWGRATAGLSMDEWENKKQ